jgi:hypothetical protein
MNQPNESVLMKGSVKAIKEMVNGDHGAGPPFSYPLSQGIIETAEAFLDVISIPLQYQKEKEALLRFA